MVVKLLDTSATCLDPEGWIILEFLGVFREQTGFEVLLLTFHV